MEPIIDQLVETHKIPKEEVEQVITHFFDKMKESIESSLMPKILITNFGTFKPSYKKISNKIRKLLILNNLKKISREDTVQFIKKIWPIKNRLAEESNGLNTWKKYRKELRKDLKKDGINKT